MNEIKKNELRIQKIKKLLLDIGEMRPGSLSQQKVKLKNGGLYQPWQISYTHKMRSKTQHVKTENLESTKLQIETFKLFKSLIQEWTDLAIENAILKSKL